MTYDGECVSGGCKHEGDGQTNTLQRCHFRVAALHDTQ